MRLIPLRKGILQRIFPKFKTSEEYVYEFDYAGMRAGFVIPAGYVFDGATMAQFITDNLEVHLAAVGHDYGYEKLGKVYAFFLDVETKTFNLNKAEVDKIFIQKIREIYTTDWKIKLYRFGIKTGGLAFWKAREWGLIK